jgi:aldose 1-epimerase
MATSTSISLTAKTPIMPTTHIYWNIGGFASPTVLEDTLHLPHANRFVVGDAILVPTGEIKTLSPGDALNFTAPKKIKEGALTAKFCGEGCVGIDNAFILDQPILPASEWAQGPVQLVWTSADTGIQMKVRTNQPSLQVYAAAAQDGTIPLKKAHSQGKSTGFLEKNGCVVIEPQGWIDGISQTSWGQAGEQIKGPGDAPYVNWAEYSFGTV